MNRTPIYVWPFAICFALLVFQVCNLSQQVNKQADLNCQAGECYSQYYGQLTNRIAQAELKVKEVERHIFLIGVLHNDNLFAIVKNSKDFIYINGDWTISKMPRYVQLTAHDRATLQKMMRPGLVEIEQKVENPQAQANLQVFVKQERRGLWDRIRGFFVR